MNNSRRRGWRVWSVSFHAPQATTTSACSGLKGLGRAAPQLQSQARYVDGADANCTMQYTGDGRQRQELCSHDRYSWEGRNEGDWCWKTWKWLVTRKMGCRYVQDRPMGCGYLQGEPFFVLKGDRLKAKYLTITRLRHTCRVLVLHAAGTNVRRNTNSQEDFLSNSSTWANVVNSILRRSSF
jgi:hypothetical protein